MRRPTWHDHVLFGLHFDLHALETDSELGRDLSVEYLVEQLKRIRPDFVQCDCKGHPGYASYPTAVGEPAPGIVRDGVGTWTDAAKQVGIPVVMHYSGVWDRAALRKHPEWGRVNSRGGELRSFLPLETDERGRDRNMTCPLSEYTDRYMIPQLMEILDRYDVDGFWVDGENWASMPCYCEKCRTLFMQRTGFDAVPGRKGEPAWEEWLAFSRDNFEDHVRRFAEAVHTRKPGCTVCSNWMYSIRQPDEVTVPVDYLSADLDWIWGLPRASAEARFMDGRGVGWDLMAWGFTSYGTSAWETASGNWTFKSVPALCQEAAVVMSCGGAFIVYDTPERSGRLIDWHMRRISEVAAFCRARQDYCQHTTSVPQAALLHSPEHYYAHNEPLYNPANAAAALDGGLALLLENHLHVDILTSKRLLASIDRYPLCVVAEQDNLSDEIVACLKDYAARGGTLLVSGAEQTRVFDELMGVKDTGLYAGTERGKPVFLPVGDETVCGLGTWRLVTNDSALEIAPLLLTRDDARRAGSPAAALCQRGKGVVACVYGPVFGTYAFSHFPGTRTFVSRVLDALRSDRLMNVEAPPWVHVTLREKGRLLLLNFVNTACDHPLSPSNGNVENVPPVDSIKVELPLDSSPEEVLVSPGEDPVNWRYRDGRLSATVARVGIHAVLVIRRSSPEAKR